MNKKIAGILICTLFFTTTGFSLVGTGYVNEDNVSNKIVNSSSIIIPDLYDFFAREIIVVDPVDNHITFYKWDSRKTFLDRLKTVVIDFHEYDEIIVHNLIWTTWQDEIIIARHDTGLLDIYDFDGNLIGSINCHYKTDDKIEIGYTEYVQDPLTELQPYIIIARHDTGLVDIYDKNGKLIRSINVHYSLGDDFIVENVTGDYLTEEDYWVWEIIIGHPWTGEIRIYNSNGGLEGSFLAQGYGGTGHDQIAVGNIDDDPENEICIADPVTGRIYAYTGDGLENSPTFTVDYGFCDDCEFKIDNFNRGVRNEILIGNPYTSYIYIYEWDSNTPILTDHCAFYPGAYVEGCSLKTGNVYIPGFELIIFVCAIGLLLLWRRRRK